MLKSLSIKNYALLADVEIQFGSGLNMLTGETGAGKSILISALGAILGDRTDANMVRSGAPKAVVEAEFETAGNSVLAEILPANDLVTDDNTVILRREVSQNSRSRAFVNDSPVTLSLLQDVGDCLVDLHGQHEHHSLLKVRNHLSFLDAFGELSDETGAVVEAYREVESLLARVKLLKARQQSAHERCDFLEFQINEINKVKPEEDEEAELVRQERVVRNGERLFNLTREFYGILYEQEHSVFDQMNKVRQGLEELSHIDEKFSHYIADFENARLTVEETANALQAYGAEQEFSAQHLEKLQARLAELSGLRKRFGQSIPEILQRRDEMSRELAEMANLDAEIEGAEAELTTAKKALSEAAAFLSQRRHVVAERLQKRLPELLLCLGMSEVRFKVELKYQDDPDGLVTYRGKNYQASGSGMDFAEFMVSLNKGEELRSLVKVASGGELSRIMLALKSIAAKREQIPVLVFDEVDSGVSGRIAQAVGRELRELSRHHQVICITHLPQIASMARQHYSVEKVVTNGRTETIIRELDQADRAEAIARLLAGERITSTHIDSAQELIADSNVN